MPFLQYVAALALAAAVAWLLAGIGSRGRPGIDRLIAAFADFFAGWRPDPWPHGVQEEDRDRPWGRPVGGNDDGGRADPPVPMPELTPLRPQIRQR